MKRRHVVIIVATLGIAIMGSLAIFLATLVTWVHDDIRRHDSIDHYIIYFWSNTMKLCENIDSIKKLQSARDVKESNEMRTEMRSEQFQLLQSTVDEINDIKEEIELCLCEKASKYEGHSFRMGRNAVQQCHDDGQE